MLVVKKHDSSLRWMMALVIAAMLFVLFHTVTLADDVDPVQFYDTFEDGVEAEGNEFFEWGSARRDGTGGYEISTDVARTGDYSMKFTYHGVPAGSDSWVEKRFDLPTERDELWLRWYQYYPDGTEGLGPKWTHRRESPHNNKFIALGNKDWYYPSSFGLYYVNTHRIGDGDSQARIYYRPDGGSAGTYYRQPTDNLGMVVDDSTRGRWIEIIIHAKLSSGYQETDGMFEMWVDGEQIYYEDDLNTWPYAPGDQDPLALEQYNIFNHGYLMGWANSGFAETSHTYIDDFSLLSGPPSSLDYTGEAPESLIPVDECNYPTEGWIFCDDFQDENSLDQYYHVYTTWGRFARHTNGIEGSRAMSSYYGNYAGDPNLDPYNTWMKLAFGKTPNDALYRPVGDPEVAEREINFRFFVRSTSDKEGDNSTGPLANVLAYGPPVDSERIPFMKVEVSYPDQSGTLQSKLYGGVFDESGEPTGNELIDTLNGTKSVMLPTFDADWHEIEIYVKLNDPGESNGVYELRIDGEIESSQTGLNWVGDYTDYGINSVEIENTNNQLGVPSGDTVNRTFDNLLLTRGRSVEEPGDPGDPSPEISGAVISGDDSIYAGDAVELTVGIAEAVSSFTTTKVTVAYDSDTLEFETDATGTALAESAIASLRDHFIVLGTAIKPHLGEIQVIMSSEGEQHAIDGSSDLFRLYGNVKDDAAIGNTTVSILDFEVSFQGTVTAVDVSAATHVIEVLEVEEPEADFTALIDMINEAQARYDNAVEGNKIGQYSAQARADLSDAIEAAALLLNDTQITQQAVDQAVAVLADAVETFSAQFISFVEGATSITISDLSIIVSYYGTTSRDPDWSDVEIADLNDNEVINNDTLTAAAQLILDEWMLE